MPQSIVAWMRAGYPAGVPSEDYVSLLGVLHRRLTECEVARIADTVAAQDCSHTTAREFIAVEIARLAKETPGDDDIERVLARLPARAESAEHVGAESD